MLPSCSSDCDDPVPVNTASVTERRVMPTVTDAAITTHNDKPHMVYYHAGLQQKNKLVLFLPDSHTAPGTATLFGNAAADMGYHVIGLRYADADFSAAAAQGNAVDFENARTEVLMGNDVSALVNIPQSESINNRLIKLIDYLDNKYPDENWAQYIINGQPDYSKMIVCGNQEGAGYAGIVAKNFAVNKLVLFSMVHDYNNAAQADAPWLKTSGWLTPAEEIYVIGHETEMEEQTELWDTMQLPGNSVLFDEHDSFSGHRKLISQEGHGGDHTLVADNSTAVADGKYLGLWQYLLTH